MADEPVTDATNSTTEATQTDATAQTATTTSTTDQQTPPSGDQPNEAAADDAGATDPLGESGLLDGDDAAAAAAADGADESADGAGDSDGETVELTGAPEGDYELELPEGMALDSAALAEISPLAKELNLSNAGLAKLATEAMPVAQKMFSASLVQDVVAQRKDWEDQSRTLINGKGEVPASPIFQGDNYDAVMKAGARAIDRFTTDAAGQPILYPAAKTDPETGEAVDGTFREFLKTTGLGNHPAMMMFAYRAGVAIGEDSDFETHGTTPQTKLSREAKYYNKT